MNTHDFIRWAREILVEVDFSDWEFHLGLDGDRPWLQVRFDSSDSLTGKIERQHGRKWMLSPFMTKSELAQTAFKAVMTASEHEIREMFTYKGRRIFGPHFDAKPPHA
jgi:hypothetical protein